MSKYRIIMDGKTYEMEVELVDEEMENFVSARPQYEKGYSNGKARDIDLSAELSTNNNGTVFNPMPGTVTALYKKEGDYVKSGEIILILEAMKMENEIVSPMDGIITNLNYKVGDVVSGGELLLVIK